MFAMSACKDVPSMDCYNVEVNRRNSSYSLAIWFEQSSLFFGTVNSPINMAITILTAHDATGQLLLSCTLARSAAVHFSGLFHDSHFIM